MNWLERKATVSLAAVFSSRMLGLFMVLPVLAVYAQHLQHSTPALIGVALGAYGLTQAFLQIPFGMLSDRIGRKPVIIAGLIIFALGSLLAAHAESIYGVIAGRMLQGAGAIASAIMALLSDLTTEQRRTRAMAMVGMSIGLSFILAMVLGPLIASGWGLEGLFISNAGLAIAAIAIVLFAVPTPQHQRCNLETATIVGQLGLVLKNHQLLRLNLGIFVLHFVLMGLFMVLPLSLEKVGIPPAHHGWIYLATLLSSFFAMVPFIIRAEKQRKMKQTFCAAVTVLGLSFAVLMQEGSHPALWTLVLAVFLFFMAFNLLEATLPSLVSKISPAGSKGSAMGAYSTCQFLGAALGGTLSGITWQYWHISGVATLCLGAIVVWWLAAITMRQPPYLSSLVLTLAEDVDSHTCDDGLRRISGVYDVMVMAGERTAYLKVERKLLDEEALRGLGSW